MAKEVLMASQYGKAETSIEDEKDRIEVQAGEFE